MLIRTETATLLPQKIGRISVGIKTDKGYPKAVDYFSLTSDYTQIVDRFISIYGDKPKSFIFRLIGDIDQSINNWFGLYDANNKVWFAKTDLSIIEYNISGKIGTIEYSPENEKKICERIKSIAPKLFDNGKELKFNEYLEMKIFIKDMGIQGGCFSFVSSGSLTTIESIRTELQRIETILKERPDLIKMVSYTALVKMVKGKGKQYPAVSITANFNEYEVSKLLNSSASENEIKLLSE